MIQTLSSYLTGDFFLNTFLQLGFVGILFIGIDQFRTGNLYAYLAYAALSLFAAYAFSERGDAIGVALVLSANVLMLAAMIETSIGTYLVCAIGAGQYFMVMNREDVNGIGVAASIGIAGYLSYAGYSLYLNYGRKPLAPVMSGPDPMPAPRQTPPPRAQENGSGLPVRQPRYTFQHIVGMADIKARLLEAGQEAVRPQGRNTEAGRNGILFYGEPGNGKTFFAEALAGQLGLRFLKLTYAEAASKWVNDTTERVKAAFETARRNAPCMLFIDEVDSFLESRDDDSGPAELNRTANALLTLINDLRGSGVVLVVATNYLDRLDQAGVREGRFDHKICIAPPDEEARRALLRNALDDRRVVEIKDIDKVVRRWEGFSVARITAAGKEAVRQAVKAGRTQIGFKEMMTAMRTMQGSMGHRLPEDTPGISGVYLPADSARKLASIAHRMVDIDRVEDLGGSIPTGVLFYGPPGTGKTFGARALAKETGWAFIATNGQELMASRDSIRSLIAKAREIRPVIVFIDEADDVLADRSTNTWSKAITNDLLTAMDGVKGRTPDIVWVAATNLPDAIDSAAVRGGRFTEKILFDLPDEATMTEYITSWMDGTRARFDSALTPSRLARLIGQVSIANAKAILQTAVNHMIGSGQDAVDADHIIGARDEVLMNS